MWESAEMSLYAAIAHLLGWIKHVLAGGDGRYAGAPSLSKTTWHGNRVSMAARMHGRIGMKMPIVIICGTVTMLGSGCATKSYVEDQVSATETRMTQLMNATETLLSSRADTQEKTLRETADRTRASRQAIDEAASLAGDAKSRADLASSTARDAEARLSQRLADRNRYRLMETRFLHFDSGRTDVRADDTRELDALATALKADANAILELQGFADPRGTDRQNNELARDRVEAVIRYLVRRHDIELRQIRAVAMGKEPSAALAQARRVDARLLAPWSSWEDTQAQGDRSDDAGAASPATTVDADRPATEKITPRAVLEEKPAAWNEIVRSIAPRDLGARD